MTERPVWKLALIGFGGWAVMIAAFMALWFIARAGCQAIMPELEPVENPGRIFDYD